MISIGDSSIPFRALLGAILSVVKRISVEPSEFNPDMKLDSIVEEQAESTSSEEEMSNDPLKCP